jgi:hypothetical protein
VEPSRIVATVSLRIERSVSACARPRPSANASAMFANTTVSHSQIEIVNVYQAGSLPPSGLPPNDLDQPRDGRDHRADLHDEHHRVADLHARVELLEAVDQRAPTMSRWNSEIAWRSWVAGICADISSFLLSGGRVRG